MRLVKCDGCGLMVESPRLPPGWAYHRDGRELCPTCEPEPPTAGEKLTSSPRPGTHGGRHDGRLFGDEEP